MAGTLPHLAVAIEYIRKNSDKIKNPRDFFNGAVMPDLTSDKDFTHYLDGKDWGNDSIRYINEPTDLEKFVLSTQLGYTYSSLY
ncbi:MAG: hypothetical protein FWE16_06140 [Firmicutes bacterium]|nr:hypothetical protein [Bacillota bacterium]